VQVRQVQARTEKLAAQIREDVETAVVALQTAQAAYEAASQSRDYQAQLLDAERDKLSVGQSTDLAVLQNEAYLAQAKSTEIAARSNWMKARISWIMRWGICWRRITLSWMMRFGGRCRRLGAGVLVVFYAVVDVVGGAVFHFEVGVGLGGALAVELEPGKAAVDVVDVAVVLVGVEGDELVEVVEGRVVGGGGIVAEGGGVVEGGPGGCVEAGLGDDDGRGGGAGGDEVSLVAAVANHVEDEEAEDDGEEDVVAGAKVA
jgi:hypothetical protein